jgi:citrate lyase subunit beta/citryl-CoA lyase
MTPVARSYLFVPGNRPERFDKACASGAHAVILDLEDAVGVTEKALARNAVAAWLDPARPVVLRVNAVDTEWFWDDVAVGALPGVRAVMLPKAESADQVRLVADRTANRVPVLPLIESAKGFDQSVEIAKTANVQRLVFGSLDFQLDLGLDGDGEETLYVRSRLVLVSRLAGLPPPVDTVWTNIDDVEQLRAQTLRSRRLGFGGKLCIHPSQVAHVNACFVPNEDEVAWAKRILEAVSRSKGSAVKLDGHMIDTPVIRRAERILNDSGRAIVPQDPSGR